MRFLKPRSITLIGIAAILLVCLSYFCAPVKAAESGESRVRYLINNEGYDSKNILVKPVNESFTVKFSRAIDINTVYQGVELIEKVSGETVVLNYECPSSYLLKITPRSTLNSQKCYYLILHKSIKDLSGTSYLNRGVVQEISITDQYSSLTVSDLNMTASNELEIRFNSNLDQTTAINKLNYSIYDMSAKKALPVAAVSLLTDNSRLRLRLLNDIDPFTQEIRVTVFGSLKNSSGTSLGNNYQQELFLINRLAGDWSSDSSFYPKSLTGSVVILAQARNLINADVSGDVYVAKDLVNVKNIKVKGTVFIDPGVAGSTTLENVEAARIEILSGSDNSILLKNVKTDELFIKSRSKIKVRAEGQTDIFKSIIQFLDDNVKLETETNSIASFGRIEVAPESTSGKTLELEGFFDKNLQIYKGVTVKNLAGFIRKVEIAVESERSPASVKLEGVCTESSTGKLYSGYLKEVEIKNPVLLAVNNAQIGYMDVNTLGVDISSNRLGYVRILNTYSKDPLLELEAGARVGAPTINTVVIKPGSIGGTTNIKLLNHLNATSFLYKVQSGEFTTYPSSLKDPKILCLSSSFTSYLDRLAVADFPIAFAEVNAAKTSFTKTQLIGISVGEDIPVLIGQDFGILALDKDDKAVAFIDHLLLASEVRGGDTLAPVLSCQVYPGSANNTTKVVAQVSAGNKLAVQISNQSLITPKAGAALVSTSKTTNPYKAGTDISGVDTSINKYLAIYELDAKNQVVRFKAVTLTANEIKGSAGSQQIGTYEIVEGGQFKSTFEVTLNGLSASHFNVFRNGIALSNVPKAIDEGIPSLPSMFTDTSILLVRFYSDVAGTLVATGRLDNGSLIITK